MSSHSNHNYPKLHNAMWPGLVGKGSPGAEPCIDLDTMLDLTAKAEVDGVKFDGVDIFLFEPHINIDISEDDLKKVADKIRGRGLVVGSVVAPIWPPTGGGPAMGGAADRKKFVGQVAEGLPDRSEASRIGRAPGRSRAHRLGLRRGRVGQRSQSQHQAHRPDVPRSLRCGGRFRRASGRRGRDLLGGNAQLAENDRAARIGGPAQDDRFPG